MLLVAWPSVAVRVSAIATVALLLAPGQLRGQIVAGTVTSEATSAPVRGAVVALLDSAGGRTPYRTLSDVSGAYALQTPDVGRFIVEVHAIGFVPRRTAPFTLGTGERDRVDVALRPISTRLNRIEIRGRSSCRLSSDLDPVTSDVWDDVWAALSSTEIALEQRLVASDVFLFTRQVDAGTGVVVYEERKIVPVLAERPFRNASAKDLAEYGYRRVSLDGGVSLFAPDPQTLTAPEFLATHCFALGADSGKDGRVGLEFRPTRDGGPGSARGGPWSDVLGTLWVDPDSRELQTLEFHYTGIPPVKGYRAEGHMSFTRLASGIWVDDQWLLRYPALNLDQLGLSRGPTARIFGSGGSVLRNGAVTILEAGGFVLTDSARRHDFSITGGYVHQAGSATQSLADVEIEVLGTPLRINADSGGAYNIFDIIPGTYDVRMQRYGQGEAGAFVLRRAMTLPAGGGVRFDVNVPSDTAVALERCPRRKPGASTAVVVGIVRDAESGWPVANQPMDVEWTQSYAVGGARPIIKQRTGSRRVTTDWRGEFTSCDVPQQSSVRVRVAQRRDAPWTSPQPVGNQLTVVEVLTDPSAADSSGRAR